MQPSPKFCKQTNSITWNYSIPAISVYHWHWHWHWHLHLHLHLHLHWHLHLQIYIDIYFDIYFDIYVGITLHLQIDAVSSRAIERHFLHNGKQQLSGVWLLLWWSWRSAQPKEWYFYIDIYTHITFILIHCSMYSTEPCNTSARITLTTHACTNLNI